MITLTIEQILQLHVLALKMGGGSPGVRDMGRLDAVVATQTQVVFGEELYEGIFSKAAAMLRGIVGDHSFADGNKRTALLVALTFIELNEYKFFAEKGELEDFAVRVATDHLEVATIANWLQEHSSSTSKDV